MNSPKANALACARQGGDRGGKAISMRRRRKLQA